MIILGKELKSCGHEVSIAAFQTFRQPIESVGLRYVQLPGDAKAYIGGIIKPGASSFSFLSRLMKVLHDTIIPLLDAIYQACGHVDAVISTFFGNIPEVIANHFQVPFTEVCFCPMYSTEDHCLPILGRMSLGKHANIATFRLAHRLIQGVEKKYTRTWLLQNGIDPFAYDAKSRLILFIYSHCLSPRPVTWSQNMMITGFLHEEEQPFSPSPELLSFLQAGPPPIYIGFGSMTSGDFQKVMPIVTSALQELHQRAILSSGWGNVVAVSQENIFPLKEYVPHGWLFKHVCAVVHHGGAGTTYAGLHEGKPTLVIPFGSDQFFWGMRVYQAGCGPKPLPYQKLTKKRLLQRLTALMQIEYQQNANLFKSELAKEDGNRTVVDILESYWLHYDSSKRSQTMIKASS